MAPRTASCACVARARWQIIPIPAEMRPLELHGELTLGCNPVTQHKTQAFVFLFFFAFTMSSMDGIEKCH